MRSYVGIVTSRGLQSLFPESDYVLRGLTRLAYVGQPVHAVCYWAAMHVPEATEIQAQLDEGDSNRAFQVLQTSATFLGPILPSDVRPLSPS
jgi:hypothetical protein